NSALFSGMVRVTDRIGKEVKGKLNAGRMAVKFAGTNDLQSLDAEENVALEQEDRRFYGGKAFYNGTNGMLEFSDHPGWKAGQREGKGDLIVIDTARDEIEARGNAWMRLPAGQLASVSQSQGTTGAGSTGTNEFAEIFAEKYHLSEGKG